MKKIVYILALAFVSSLAFSACTEEEVKPNTEYNGGGNGSDPL